MFLPTLPISQLSTMITTQVPPENWNLTLHHLHPVVLVWAVAAKVIPTAVKVTTVQNWKLKVSGCRVVVIGVGVKVGTRRRKILF